MNSTELGLCHVRVEWIVTLLAQNIFEEEAMTLCSEFQNSCVA